MKNLTLRVNIEGMQEKVMTDWNAISATLKQRHCSVEELAQLHDELSAGLLATTRGLTLAKYQQETSLDNIIKTSALIGAQA